MRQMWDMDGGEDTLAGASIRRGHEGQDGGSSEERDRWPQTTLSHADSIYTRPVRPSSHGMAHATSHFSLVLRTV